MHDSVDLLSFEDITDQLRAANIALDELVVRVVLDFTEILDARAVCEQS